MEEEEKKMEGGIKVFYCWYERRERKEQGEGMLSF
jgi:hypothetical protein